MSTPVLATQQLVEVDDAYSIRMGRKPEPLIAEAQLCATALLGAVRKNGWAQSYGGKREHLYFEAWAFLATMYRVTARIKETRLIQIGDTTGYEATAEAFHVPSQTVISTADAMCLDDEENWDQRTKYEYNEAEHKRVAVGKVRVPLFQLRSMAQTRAMSKALRAPFSWIVAMAGYDPAAAEDVGGSRQANNRGSSNSGNYPKAPPQQQQSADGKITAKQASRIWALGNAAGKTKDDVEAVIKAFGFASAADVTTAKYEELCAEVQKGDAQ